MAVFETFIDAVATARTVVRVGAGALATLPDVWPAAAGRAFVIADARVRALHGARVFAALAGLANPVVLDFPPGEPSKTRAGAERLVDQLLAARVERGDVIVALGGGVAMDLAGFAAATCLRGLRLVSVPTSLLAVVDASLGGKNGVDTPLGKNLVGTIHPPVAVVADTDLLRTLAAGVVREGVAEMVKAAVVGDAGLLDRLEAAAPTIARGEVPDDDVVARAVAVKVAVVGRDPFECGERRVLNFGHTVAHGLEAASGFAVTHGDAVAIGMVIEARVATCVGFAPADADRLARLIASAGLPIAPSCPFDRVLPFLAGDKKARGGAIRMALPRRPGQMEDAGGEWAVVVSPEAIEAAWHA